MELAKRPSLLKIIHELCQYTNKRTRADMLWHVLSNFKLEKEQRVKFENENALLRLQLEYAEGLLKK
jgi:hypothetical protein